MRQEYTRTQGQFSMVHFLACFREMGRNQTTHKETHMDTKRHRESNLGSGAQDQTTV